MAESKDTLNAERVKVIVAKIRCLDRFMADNSGKKMFGSDYDYIADMKDWVDKKNIAPTVRQAWRVEQIWNHITDRVELDFEDYMDTPV